MKNKRRIYSVDGKNYLIDTEKHCLFDVDFIGSLTNGVRIFSCCFNAQLDGDRRYGFVDKDFTEVVVCQYAYISAYKDGIYRASMRNPAYSNELTNKHFYFYIDRNGVPIHLVEVNGCIEKLVRFNEYKAISEFNTWGMAVSLSYDDKQGVVNSDGSIFLEPQYKSVKLNGSQRHIEVKMDNISRTILYFEVKKRWEFIPKGYEYQSINEKEQIFIVKYENHLSVLDFEGKQIIPPIYKNLIFRENYVIATDDKGKMGVLDRFNYQNILIDFEYDRIEESFCKYKNKSKERFLVLIKDKKQGIFSMMCRKNVLPIVFPIDVKIVPDFINDGFILFEGFCKKGFMDVEGNVILTYTGNILSFPKNGVMIVSSGRKWIKLNDVGELVEEGVIQVDNDMYEEEYDSVVYTEEDTWDAMTDGMYGDYPGGDIDYEVMGF